MPNASEIYEQLAKFLSRQQGINEFHEWLGRHSWDNYLRGDLHARDLAGSIELALAEYGNGDIDRDQLLVKLFALLKNREVTLIPAGFVGVFVVGNRMLIADSNSSSLERIQASVE